MGAPWKFLQDDEFTENVAMAVETLASAVEQWGAGTATSTAYDDAGRVLATQSVGRIEIPDTGMALEFAIHIDLQVPEECTTRMAWRPATPGAIDPRMAALVEERG